MNFTELLAKMQQLDQPVPEAVPAPESTVAECPPDMPSAPAMSKPDTPPPSMSVNLNAQGLDDIAELMKLMTKVNPDMINQPSPTSMPPVSAEPSIMSIKPPMSSIGDLGNLDAGPLKMLPLDLDKGEEGPGKDGSPEHEGPEGENPEPEEKDEKEKAEWANSPDTDVADVDAAIPDGNDLNKPKKSFSGKAYRGDNPMAANAYESTDLRAAIRAELLQRLAEAKGDK